jgi:molybdopterin molybdotransferase
MSDLMPFEAARAQLLAAVRPVSEYEVVALAAARNRVLAEPIHSPIAIPERDTSAMDGYAVRAADVAEPGVTLPVTQRIPAGSVGVPLQPGTAARIFTGAPLPEGADAVVMQEMTEAHGDHVTFHHAPRPGEAVRRAGSEVARGARVLEVGTRLRPQEIAMAASVGCAHLPVFRRVKVALLATGDELVAPGEPLPPGGVYNSNRYQLIALLEALGCLVTDLGAIPDTLEATCDALARAAEDADLILSTGGVSVGEADHVKPAVERLGRLDLWRLRIKPGKPLAFGHVGATHFVGLPGNPVSSFVTFLLLVRPLLLRLMGVDDVLPHVIDVPAAFAWTRPDKRREFLRARLNADGAAEIFPDQGSATIASLVWAQGLVEVPEGTPIAPGDRVRFWPMSELLA